jgi:EpsI family protein
MSLRALILAAMFVVTTLVLAQASKAEPTPIREPLSSMPLVLDGWQGRVERDFAPSIIEVLGVDDYTNRSYFAPGNGRRVGLYVGYHSTQRHGDTIHSPLNCLPGAGWLPVEQSRVTMTVNDPATGDERQIEINRVLIERGLDRQLVYYWYQSQGRVVASEYWGKVYTVVDAIRLNRTEAALVRVIAPASSRDMEEVVAADKAARAFVQVLFPHLGRHLPS